jgi:hypothetical protein
MRTAIAVSLLLVLPACIEKPSPGTAGEHTGLSGDTDPASGDSGPAGDDTDPQGHSAPPDTGDDIGDDTGGGDDTDTAAPSCEVAVVSTTPTDGASWFYRDPLYVSFDGDGGGAGLALVHVDSGEAVGWGDQTWDEGGLGVWLTPGDPLQASSDYRLTVDLCGARDEIDFTTTEAGAPIEDGAASLVGRTWVIELGEQDFVEPEGLGTLIASYVALPVLVGVEAVGSSSVDLIVAQGVLHRDGYYYQDTRVPGQRLSGATWEDPWFSARAAELVLWQGDVELAIYDLTLENTFSADGQDLLQGSLSGSLDTRSFGVWLGDPDDEGAACDAMEIFGVICEACASDHMPFCVDIAARDVTGGEQAGLALE